VTRAQIGVFGGSGLYSLLDDAETVEVDTPYGPPSASPVVGTVGPYRVAFMPRHGVKHELPPHAINYRANLWAMKELGVERILGPCAAGSLQTSVGVGEFVVCDQVVDRTRTRSHTFYDGPGATHVSFADPYCTTMRPIVIDRARELGIRVHDRGTMVVIEGPRFSTRAESAWFNQMGWQVIGMTGYPEVVLARELEICYANVSLITDYDVGVPGAPPVSHEEVVTVFGRNVSNVRDLLFATIPALPAERDCECATALDDARVEVEADVEVD
jgi:5'-methylthioadenosine phosphorylase